MIRRMRGAPGAAFLLLLFPGYAGAFQDEQGRTMPPEQPAGQGSDAYAAWHRELEAWLQPPPPDQPQPRFVCEKRSVDAGDVWEGSKTKAVWTVWNAGDAPLRMRAAFGGCMTAGGRTIFSLAPGETGEIEGKVGACFPLGRRSRCGPRVWTNDRRKAEVDLDAIANVRSAIRTGFDDISIRSFTFDPFSYRAGPQTKTIQIRRGDGGPLRLAVKSVSPEGATAELREIEAGERYELTVTLKPPWPAYGPGSGVIALATGVELQPEAKIGFTTDFQPRVRVVPGQITIPRWGRGEEDYSTSLVWSDDLPPGRILEAAIDDPSMSVRVETSGNRQVVSVHVPAHERPLKKTYWKVTLKTDDSLAPEVQIPVIGAPAKP